MDSSFINLDNYNGAPFHLYQNLNVKNNKSNNMTGRMCKTQLSDLYFSQANVDYLQDSIISNIYNLTNQKIGKQSEDELMIVMRSIFLQNSTNNDSNFNSQINILNKKVLDYCVNNVKTNLLQHNDYIKHITSERKVMDKPQFVNIKGEKTLMPKHFFQEV